MATAAGKGRRLTADEIAKYAYQAGFRGQALTDAVAIALAESGGVVDAHNPRGEDSQGLWQINVSPKVRENKWGDLFDPAVNARAAFEVSGGGKNFKPWTTYAGSTEAGRASSYKAHLGEAEQAAAGAGDPLAPAETASTAASSSTTADDELAPDASPQEITDYIKSHYPEAVPYLNNPEIRALLVRPDIDSLDNTEIQALLQGTNYWKTHGAPSRAFDALIAQDGNAAGDLVDRVKNLLADTYDRQGFHLTGDKLGDAAKKVIRAGWVDLSGKVADAGAFNDYIAGSIRQTGKSAGGETAASADSLVQKAHQYGITLSQPTASEWALKMVEGRASDASFDSYLTNLAKAMWSNDTDVVKAIDMGITPADYFSPHQQAIAKILELTPDQVDIFGDPRWQSVMQTYDPAIKGKRSMTLGEVAQLARSDPRYANTQAYKQADASLALQLGQFLGKAG